MAHQPFDHYYLVGPPAAEHPTNEIKTLFISGLPDDVKAREIHNLFRYRPGFEACQLKYTGRGNQVVAFAVFYNHQSAVAALQSLNGVIFDPETGSTLHIELARTNSWRQRKPGSGPYVVIDNRNRASSKAREQDTSSSDGESESNEPSGAERYVSGDKGNAKSDKPGGASGAAETINEAKATEGIGQPCSTLFIANLGPKCTEDELKQVLSTYPGFNVLKMRARSGMPVAFADFEEVEQATKAMEELEGSLLESSDRGGMHIEYARSKMRKL